MLGGYDRPMNVSSIRTGLALAALVAVGTVFSVAAKSPRRPPRPRPAAWPRCARVGCACRRCRCR
ncbi:hypothetical protein [Lysobacter gummosus]|uniref:hypothetical protein n=1 Tax=Lysobacter gummosus TaxID=262324 RepID=UPI00362725A3